MFKKIFLCLTLTFFANTFSFAEDTRSRPTDHVNFVFVKDADNLNHERLDIFQNGKRIQSLPLPYRIGFMLPLGGADYDKSDTKYRLIFEGIYTQEEQNFNYKDYLVDITGSGEKRYLIVGCWSGGNHGLYSGYLIDAKDNFAVLGPIPCYEAYDYPMPNPNLVFRFFDEIFPLDAESSQSEVAIFVDLKLQKGKEPVFATVKPEKFSLVPYKNALNTKAWTDARVFTIGQLYCDLASYGLLKDFKNYAKQLDFTDDEIAKAHEYYRKEIRESKFYKYLKELNPGLL